MTPLVASFARSGLSPLISNVPIQPEKPFAANIDVMLAYREAVGKPVTYISVNGKPFQPTPCYQNKIK